MNAAGWVKFNLQRAAVVQGCTMLLLLLLLLQPLAKPAHAESNTANAPQSSPKAAVSATARLDFALTLGSFISLQVGSSGGTVDTVGFDLASLASPACTATPLPVCFGNGTPVAASTHASLPVTVKSNGGQVSLKASVVTPLSNGSSSIPMSQLLLSSSDATHLPAPVVPNTGSGNSVNVAPTSFAAKVTNRTANWSFAYANTVTPMAGIYNGQVLFTATTP